jgi:hypothetical protein
MDDVAAVAAAPTLLENTLLLEAAAQTIFQWAQNNAIAFDDSKTELLHFTKQRSRHELGPPVALPNGTTVQPVAVLCWLGVWLDRKLTFHTHVQTKLAAAERALSGLLRLSSTEKGLSIGNMRQLYQACVVPIADFGSEIWWKGQKGLERKLQTLQNTATRRILGAFRTTPTALLDVESALPPASIRLTQNQRRYALCTLRLPPHHPIVQRMPQGFHPSGTGQLEEDLGGTLWDETVQAGSTPHATTLIRVIHTLSRWFQSGDKVEEVASSMANNMLLTPINFGNCQEDKNTAAEMHN